MKNLLILFLVFMSATLKAQPKESNFSNISKIGVSVNDLEKASGFYSNVFGLEKSEIRVLKNSDLEKKNGVIFSKGRSQLVKGQNSGIELMQFKQNQRAKSKMPVKGPGITHICYQSPDDKPLYFKALEQGAEKLSKGDKPIDRGFGVKYAYSRDFDGNIFEMEQLRKPNFENEVWMGHVAIATPNIDSLVQFYTQLFGEDPVSRRNNIHNDAGLDSIGNINGLVLNGAWFRIGNMGLEIWQFVNPVTPQANGLIPYTETGYNKITFEIRNFESEMENIKKRGLFPSIDFKAKRALIRDSDGNLLELSGL